MAKELVEIRGDRDVVARSVASLEADLKRVSRDAEAFGQDLKLLRMENDKLKTKDKDEMSKASKMKLQHNKECKGLIS